MLTFLFLSSIVSLLFYQSLFYTSFVLILSWLYYLFYSSFFSNQCFYFSFMNDEVSLFMVYITVFVLYISYVYSISFKSLWNISLVFISMLIFCLGVFSSSNLFLIYFFYEASLLPILYIIIKWGSYPERSLSAMMLLIYTSVFTFPFIAVMFYQIHINYSFSVFSVFTFSYTSFDFLSSIIIFFTFAVKLPIYGLHFWLPMAHVEAPTFGSMILAGILLNLGGVGLLRCLSFLDISFLYASFLSYFIVFLIFVTFVCLFQSDFKRLVAYSSVSHIMAIPILLLSNTLISYNSIIIIMLFHGLSSPILFMLVGVLYSIFSSRQLIAIRGLLLLSPLLSFIIIMAFFFTLSAPPFPSFVAEVYFLISSYYLSNYIVYIFIIFTFFSLVYNLNWLTSIVFSSSTPSNISFSISFKLFMPLIVSFFFCVLLSSIFFLLW